MRHMKHTKRLLYLALILALLTGCMSRPAPVREAPLPSETEAVSERTLPDQAEAPASAVPDEEATSTAPETEPDTVEAAPETTASVTEPPTEPTTEAEAETSAEPPTEAPTEPSSEPETEAPIQIIADSDGAEAAPDRADTGTDYVLNKNTMKFHYPTCSSVGTIKDSNRVDFHGTRDEVLEMGYDPCKRCKP